MYSGSVRLSFCTDNASSSDDNTTAVVYLIVCPVRLSYCLAEKHTEHTENGSTSPHSRRIHAHPMTDRANAALPSRVFEVVGDHRRVPIRFPTIEAYTMGEDYWVAYPNRMAFTKASPTPNASIPVNCINAVGLPDIHQRKHTMNRMTTDPSSQTEPALPVSR